MKNNKNENLEMFGIITLIFGVVSTASSLVTGMISMLFVGIGMFIAGTIMIANSIKK
jgi:uncharacterized membrane protein HdeD (DUF308 family)